jgi:hypothetical protein
MSLLPSTTSVKNLWIALGQNTRAYGMRSLGWVLVGAKIRKDGVVRGSGRMSRGHKKALWGLKALVTFRQAGEKTSLCLGGIFSQERWT